MRASVIFTILSASMCAFAQSPPLPNKSPSQEVTLVADLTADLQRAAIQMLKEQVSTPTKRTESPPADAEPSKQMNQSKTVTQAPSEGAMQSDSPRGIAVKTNKSEHPNIQKQGRETITASGAILRIVDCSGQYQGVAGVPPKAIDLGRSTPSNTYSDAVATEGIFPLAREAIDFYWSVCKPQPGYAARPPNNIWFFADQLPPGDFHLALSDGWKHINVRVSGTNSNTPPYSWKPTSWSVRNGPADLALKNEASRRQHEAEQSKQAQVALQQEQSNAKREAFLKQYGAIQIPKMGILRSNPFSLEGKIIAIPVKFRQMHNPTVGSFEVLTSLNDIGGLIIVSDIPRGTFVEPIRAFLAAKVIGLTPVQGIGEVPHLKYAGVIVCPGAKPFSSCP